MRYQGHVDEIMIKVIVELLASIFELLTQFTSTISYQPQRGQKEELMRLALKK